MNKLKKNKLLIPNYNKHNLIDLLEQFIIIVEQISKTIKI